MPTLDAHHHFWRYSAAEYGWINAEMRAIRRDFLPADLRLELAAQNVDGVISVQARQTLEETRWLLDLADANDFIRGVVGWVPLVDPAVGALLEQLVAQPKLRGVRHVLQGEAEERYMLRDDFNRGLARLTALGLAYDILIFERQLSQTVELVDRHPQQTFILDHVAKPRVKDQLLEPWRQNLRALARRPNVYCKISGLVTEAEYSSWNVGQLRPYLDAALEAFGPARLMFGSDWPVCLVAAPYARWLEVVRDWARPLTQGEQEQIFGLTAEQAYRL